jgi:hypothetical protein
MQPEQAYAPALLRKAERMLHSREDAQDVVYALLLERRAQREPNDALDALFRALTQRCLERLREPARADQPRDTFLAKLSQLDREQAALLVYRYLDNLAPGELASFLGLSRQALAEQLRALVGAPSAPEADGGCVSAPISWLRLERHALGLVTAAERLTIGVHLARCPACSACMQRIEGGGDLLRLPLPAAPVAARLPGERRRAWRFALACLGALIVLVWLVHRPARDQDGAAALALELVRVGADGQQREPTHFAPGDRFRVLLSCAPGQQGALELVVYRDGQRSFPWPTQRLERCGQRRTLPGAFSIDGASATSVCAVPEGSSPLARQTLASSPERLSAAHVCRLVQPGS